MIMMRTSLDEQLMLTKRQQKQYLKVCKLFPYLQNNKPFMFYVTCTSIDSDFVTEEDVNGNTVIKFSGFSGDNRTKYNISFTYCKDNSFAILGIWEEHWGFSDIKFMPFTITNRIARYNANGELIYSHSEEDITYTKQLKDEAGKVNPLLDPSRSGIKVTETILIDKNTYLISVTSIKGKTKYYEQIGDRAQVQITESEFVELGREHSHLSPKVKTKKM